MNIVVTNPSHRLDINESEYTLTINNKINTNTKFMLADSGVHDCQASHLQLSWK